MFEREHANSEPAATSHGHETQSPCNHWIPSHHDCVGKQMPTWQEAEYQRNLQEPDSQAADACAPYGQQPGARAVSRAALWSREAVRSGCGVSAVLLPRPSPRSYFKTNTVRQQPSASEPCIWGNRHIPSITHFSPTHFTLPTLACNCILFIYFCQWCRSLLVLLEYHQRT